MSLQKKVVVVFLTLAAVFSIGSYAGLTAFIFPTFEEFEQQSAVDNLQRMERAISAELRALEVVNREYSEWDHTYDFALGRRDDYVAENLDTAFWTNIDVDMMMYFDLNGAMLWGAIVDKSKLNELELGQQLQQPISADHPLIMHGEQPGVSQGVLQTYGDPLLVSSQPILTSTAAGPPVGTLIIGKYLDADLLAQLAERARVGANFLTIDDPSLPQELLADIPLTTINKDRISLHQAVTDVFGSPAFVMQVTTPRTITTIGSNTIAAAFVFFVVATAVFLLGAWLFMRNSIVAPIMELTQHFSKIRKTGNLEKTLDSTRNDEIGELALEFGELANSLRDAQKELEGARDQALAISNAKSDFLAKMSHEIRTPLNGVLGMIELLNSTPLAQNQKHYAHAIQGSADTLLEIISDILDFSKIEAGKLSLDNKAFELNAFVVNVVDSLSGLAEQKGLRLSYILPENASAVVEADAVRLRQVLTNLIGNAIKFTERGSVLLKVSSTFDRGDYEILTFEVIDTGVGIARHKQEQIFDSFAQEDGSTTRRYGGTGLGLAISKQLIELMGSCIRLKSAKGEGSSFSFDLRLRTHGGKELPGDTITFGQYSEEASTNITEFQRLRGTVLVAEDNAVSQAVATGMLSAIGVNAEVASNGREAVEMFSSGNFDAILMDCQMPVLDGYQASAEIRRLESRANSQPIRIIAVTANVLAGDMEKCLAAGMDDYIRKPYKGENLYAALASVLPQSEMQARTESDNPVTDSLAPFDIPQTDAALDSDVLDEYQKLPHTGNQDLVQQVIRSYLSSSLDLMNKLAEAIESRDAECIRSSAHAMKSSSANVGATRLSQLCQSLETSTRSDDHTRAQELRHQIQKEYPLVMDALNRRLSKVA